MKRREARMGWWAGSVIILSGGLAVAQPPQLPEPIYHETFEEGIQNWIGLGKTANISLVKEPENVHEGNTALRFDYALEPNQFNALGSIMPPGVLGAVKAFKLWIKSREGGSFAMILQEKDGGRYAAIIHAPADTWQQVEIEPADFLLQEGANDPKDPNGQLDLEQVEGSAIADLNQIFVSVQDENLARLLNIKPGSRTLYLDDVVISGNPLLEAAKATEGETIIDAFNRPQFSWIGIGGMKLGKAKDVGVEGPALQVEYHREKDRFTGLVKSLKRGLLVGKKQLTFQAASMQPATLIVQVEETGGGKYNTAVEVPGGAQAAPVAVSFSNFKPADDSKDNNDRLDLDQVKQLLILDVAGLLGVAEGDNTLWIGELRARQAELSQ